MRPYCLMAVFPMQVVIAMHLTSRAGTVGSPDMAGFAVAGVAETAAR